jgi:tetratricopeptide (TPR) repeat protein
MGSARRALLVLLCLAAVALPAGLAARFSYTTRPGYLLARGRAALDRGDVAEALARADQLQHYGYGPPAHLLRGEAWLTVGRAAGPGEAPNAEALRRALRSLGQIDDEGPLAAEGAVRAGECLVRLGDHHAAADVLEVVVRSRPDDREAHRWLAAVYIDLSSPTQAIHHLEEWGRRAPEDGRPYRWIGLFRKDYNQFDAAADAYREALRRRLTPDDQAAVTCELAEALLEGPGDFRAALAALDQCPQPWAARPEVAVLRAEALWGLGRLDEAADVADRVLRDAPGEARALRLRGRLYLAADQPARARPLLEKAVALDPYDLVGRQHLAEACVRLGDAAAADEQRRRAEDARRLRDRLTSLYVSARERPWDDSVRQEIAGLCLRMNRRREARTMLRAALACNAGNEPARRLLDRLDAEDRPRRENAAP